MFSGIGWISKVSVQLLIKNSFFLIIHTQLSTFILIVSVYIPIWDTLKLWDVNSPSAFC